MNKRKLFAGAGCAFALLLAGCSEPAQTTADKKAEAPQPITGQSALWRMYPVARSWAPDAEVLKLDSIPMPEVPAGPGKAAAWEATFTSSSKGRARRYTYSSVEAEGNLHEGVFASNEEGWSGPRGGNAPFMAIAVKVDTDAAYKTAQAKAAEYEKKNPGKTINFLLEKITKYPNPVWRVIWGESVSTSGFSVYVDASTGQYLETLH